MKWKMTTITLAAAGAIALSMAATYAPAATKTTTAAPTVTTLAASNVTSTSATFNGTVNPGGLATTSWFQWTPADGDTNTTKAIAAGTSAVSISVSVTGLKASTTYKFTAYAWNSKGQKNGTTLSFKTLAAVVPPTKTIYLTFDDGPYGRVRRQRGAVRPQAAGAHATFFEIGQSTYTIRACAPQPRCGTPSPSYATCLANASKSYGNYGLVRQLVASGNVVGTHSWDHPNFADPLLSPAQTATEISQARNLQVAVAGTDSKLFRFPYNAVTQNGLNYLSSQGMRSVGADIDPSDWNWQTFTDQDVINNVIASAYDGAVVQLHDGQDVLGRDGGHPGYLPALLTQLKASGYSFGTLTVGGTAGSQAQVNGGEGSGTSNSSNFPAQKVGSANNNA